MFFNLVLERRLVTILTNSNWRSTRNLRGSDGHIDGEVAVQTVLGTAQKFFNEMLDGWRKLRWCR